MIGIDLVRNPATREPDPELAGRLITGALRRGWLLLAGGPEGNVISLSPPLTISRALLDSSVRMLDELLGEASAGSSSAAD
jgi:4-aminobutyrate aminotransferase/(S)-3-amino-2-methylpropionate transaminase